VYKSNPSNANFTFKSVYYYPNTNIPNVSETDTVVLNYSMLNESYYQGTDGLFFEINNNILKNMSLQSMYRSDYSSYPTKTT